MKLVDATVDRLQLQDFWGRWLPRGKRHSLEIAQNPGGVHGVGLGPLHACPREILDCPRVDHHYFHVLGIVQGERERQAVNPSRLQANLRWVATFGYPTNEFPVPGRGVRKRCQRQPLSCTLHCAH